jgi:hypothetical protein
MIRRSILEPARSTVVIDAPEVLVVGSGPAGIGAAIAAARNGARTLLVEEYGYLGGNLTCAMVNPMFTFHDVQGEQVIRGIPGELVERLVGFDASPGHVTDLTFDNASMTPFDPEGMKQVLFDMVTEAGIGLLLHSKMVDVIRDGSRISAVVIESKSGRQALTANVVIDCTADGDVAARAGVKYILGRENDGAMQPATLYLRIGEVDYSCLRSWMKANRSLLKDHPSDEEIDSQDAIAFLGLHDLIKAAQGSGELDPNMAPRALLYQLPGTGQISVNWTRLQKIDGTNVADLTRAEVETRRQAWQIYRFLKKYVGGFEHSRILDTAAQVGIRETRHIAGDYRLSRQDVLSSRHFEDGIACGTFAIDIHPPEGEKQIFTGSGKAIYEIPYRSCTPKGLENTYVAGRCIDATHEAFGSVRVMATAMAIGQGVGTAAALAVRNHCGTREVNIEELRGILIKQGVYLLGAEIPSRRNPCLELKRTNGNGAVGGHFNPFANSPV